MTGRASGALLAVVFATGRRPTLAQVSEWCPVVSLGGFAVTHSAREGELVWAEILASGLAFDCAGLGDGVGVAVPLQEHRLGLDTFPQGEAVSLAPGPHIASGANLQPVVRTLVSLGTELAAMPGAKAVCWLPAGCWMAPAYFSRIVNDWLSGGPFPALGLTMLNRLADGRIETEGLGFFIGQDLIIEANDTISPDRMAQLAIRLINELIARGPILDQHVFAFDGFPTIMVQPATDTPKMQVAFRADVR